MEEITLGQVTVDRCTKCHGVWFDAMEREQLMALPGSAEDLEKDCIWERTPPEASAMGENPGGYKGINCPRCQVKMEPVWVRRKKIHNGARWCLNGADNAKAPTSMLANSRISKGNR